MQMYMYTHTHTLHIHVRALHSCTLSCAPVVVCCVSEGVCNTTGLWTDDAPWPSPTLSLAVHALRVFREYGLETLNREYGLETLNRCNPPVPRHARGEKSWRSRSISYCYGDRVTEPHSGVTELSSSSPLWSDRVGQELSRVHWNQRQW